MKANKIITLCIWVFLFGMISHYLIIRNERKISIKLIRSQESDINEKDDAISGLKKEVHRLQRIVDETSKVTVIATAYNKVPEQTNEDFENTACMVNPNVGSIAVSQDLFYQYNWSCGKRVFIKGLGIFTIKDVMHYRKRKQIDIVMSTKKKADDFGRMLNLSAVLLTNYEDIL